MGQVLQRDLWQGNEPGVGRGGRGTRLVLTRSLIIKQVIHNNRFDINDVVTIF